MRGNWNTQTNTWRDEAVMAKSATDEMRLVEIEIVEKVLGERNAVIVCLYKVVCTLRRISKARGEKSNNADDMRTKVSKIYQQARDRVVGPRAAEVPELRNKTNTLNNEVETENLRL